MKEIRSILEKAQLGDHTACQNCPRNPIQRTTAFASCCEEHFGFSKNGLIVMLRDPGANNVGASHTGKICPYHNDDITAKLLRAYLPLLEIGNDSVYLVNAILHGFYDVNSKKNNDRERKCCRTILQGIINHLEPRIILALGLEALQTTLEILKGNSIQKPTLKEMIANSFSYGKISEVNVFSMPHPAYAKTNLGKNGLREEQVWKSVAERINKTFHG